ncbi:hypothetical protein BpHYR1_014675 [Brachionus plicatilis]|uniref:Uncharacterized protein n=1 Tax=Brachionus plicatilis TaxID=10195 RepID=A0A3M7RHW8_BRAPC|nr:hypothetical protein BpHYR1_014675 [Brachionus plicatilis]
MAVRVNQANLNTSNQSINSNTDSLKLVSKIRKIKENLDQCYTNTSLNRSLNSTICSDTLSNQLNVNNQYVNKSGYKSSNPSKYILVSRQALDFELNNNPISLDNLALDQFSEKLTNSFRSDQELNQAEVPNLKHAVYSENVSRQSSIRSLLTEKNSKFLPNTNMANMKNNFAKIKKIKTRNQLNDEFQEFNKEELNLLQDWDKSSSCRDSPLHSRAPSRPTTRLGFQNEPDWNNLEYSDNVTIASSSSNETNSKYQDMDEYENILDVPKPIECRHLEWNDKNVQKSKRDDESESILSDLVTHLQFEEQKSANNLAHSRFKDKYFQNRILINYHLWCVLVGRMYQGLAVID